MSDFTNDPRLKPCPLCGGHAHIAEVVRTFGPSAYFAACDDQDCRLFEVPGVAHYRKSVDEAVEAWNDMPRCSDCRQLAKARAEAEKYRELLGIARDHAHAALVDTEGNVLP